MERGIESRGQHAALDKQKKKKKNGHKKKNKKRVKDYLQVIKGCIV